MHNHKSFVGMCSVEHTLLVGETKYYMKGLRNFTQNNMSVEELFIS